MDIATEKREQAQELAVILSFDKTGEYAVEPLVEIADKPLYIFIKLMFDFVMSSLILLASLGPVAVIATVVSAMSEIGTLFTRDRQGKNCYPFHIIKFSTMRKDADQDGARRSRGDNDGRITRVGAFLRKMRLGEQPQFWRILKGDIRFVGPWPERKVLYDGFKTYIHGLFERMKVKSWLAAFAQDSDGYFLRPEEKVLRDAEYVKTRSFRLDTKMLFGIIGVILTWGRPAGFYFYAMLHPSVRFEGAVT